MLNTSAGTSVTTYARNTDSRDQFRPATRPASTRSSLLRPRAGNLQILEDPMPARAIQLPAGQQLGVDRRDLRQRHLHFRVALLVDTHYLHQARRYVPHPAIARLPRGEPGIRTVRLPAGTPAACRRHRRACITSDPDSTFSTEPSPAASAHRRASSRRVGTPARSLSGLFIAQQCGRRQRVVPSQRRAPHSAASSHAVADGGPDGECASNRLPPLLDRPVRLSGFVADTPALGVGRVEAAAVRG